MERPGQITYQRFLFTNSSFLMSKIIFMIRTELSYDIMSRTLTFVTVSNRYIENKIRDKMALNTITHRVSLQII